MDPTNKLTEHELVESDRMWLNIRISFSWAGFLQNWNGLQNIFYLFYLIRKRTETVLKINAENETVQSNQSNTDNWFVFPNIIGYVCIIYTKGFIFFPSSDNLNRMCSMNL